MKKYEPRKIEPKWQKIWRETNLHTVDFKNDKPKYYAFSMFNYPSGDGIHTGHAMNYTISDIKARLKRQQGYESYLPVGWDSFGLPVENYAIKKGVSPQESMANIIPGYHKQYQAMGWSNDWEKEIATHLPEYYKWTQWLFVKMHEAGLAYQDSRQQWWCTKCQTVLANEQVIDDKCWRHDGPDDPIVEKQEIKQWFFKITDYADELLDAVDELDWTDSVKLAQKNWIGKSEGVEIEFAVDNSEEKIHTFTTRIDTLFGATFLVLAPEHHLVQKITSDEHKDSIKNYVAQASKKSEVDRQSAKEKTGVSTGAYAINPINNQKIPVWVADYVLMGYGTGAIMAVPAHDERDFEFAKKYDIEITQVIMPSAPDDNNTKQEEQAFVGCGELINSDKYNGLESAQAKVDILRDLSKKSQAKEKINYRMRDWSVSRQRYWGAPIPVIYCGDCGVVVLDEESLPVILPELDDFQPSGDGRSALARAKDWLKVDCIKCGKPAERETDTLDTYVCSSWYMMRYLDPFNQQQPFEKDVAKKWWPVDFYNGADHATAHLLYARFISRFLYKQGLVPDPEPFKQFLFNGKVTASDGTMFSKSKGNGVDPLEIISQGYGADALRIYTMFAGPLELPVLWDPQGVPGAYRFLNRVWALVQDFTELEEGELDDKLRQNLEFARSKMIKKVEQDIETNRYNTAIAACMAGLNDYQKIREQQFVKSQEWQDAIEALLMCVAPFAPHIAEELWQDLGHSDSINKDHWPEVDENALQTEMINMVVQINGKVRAQIEVAADMSEKELIELAKQDDKVKSHLADVPIKRTIYVSNKLVNFVV